MRSGGLFTRRGFLSTGLVAAGGSMAMGQAAQLESGAVPPAIAALPSLSGKARPFTNAELQARIERARALMTEHKIDAIVLPAGSTSLRYFANLHTWSSERLMALVLSARAKPFLISPAFEADRAHELLSNGPLSRDAEVLAWEEDESPYETLAKGLRDRGLAAATVGIDEETKFVFAEGIRAANPHIAIVSATPVTAGCRMIKDAHEIECMRLANRATLLVYRAVAQSVHPGMLNTAVEKLVEAAYRQVGFRGDASLNVDEYTAVPHGSSRPQTLREGSILMLDDGCEVEGYWSDITRVFVLGKPSAKMIAVFDIVKRAQKAALHAARPGALAADVDAAARKVIADAGYGPGFRYFTHRLGHGIGMDGHEWPYLVKNNMFSEDRSPHLMAGMTFSDEPGVYIKGEFGIRLEDDMVITQDGAELLTPQSPSLEDPFGNVA